MQIADYNRKTVFSKPCSGRFICVKFLQAISKAFFNQIISGYVGILKRIWVK